MIWALGALLLGSPSSAAGETEPAPCKQDHRNCRAISLQLENDLFGEGSDRHFTNGMRVSYLFPLVKNPGFTRWLLDKLPTLPDQAELRVIGALGQNIFTPDDISSPDLVPDDRPYAGWLYGEVGLAAESPHRRDSFVLSLGVIGPASLARQTQTWWHRVINVELPMVADLQAGAAVVFNLGIPMRLTYNFIYRSREFKAQEAADKFGSISLSVMF